MSRRHLAVLWCGLLALGSGGAQAVPEAYLAAVRADVEEFTSGRFKAPAESDWLGDEDAAGEGTATMEGFEEFLKSKFRGTYILYKGLPEAQRITIWEAYVQTGDLGAMRSSIFSMRSKRVRKPRRRAIRPLPYE